ncbi:hypothetical protein K1719_016960 [Acacia pycnantha]|nr:hypothetical protein K1719_016960 [Acacia pycnantha]
MVVEEGQKGAKERQNVAEEGHNVGEERHKVVEEGQNLNEEGNKVVQKGDRSKVLNNGLLLFRIEFFKKFKPEKSDKCVVHKNDVLKAWRAFSDKERKGIL